MSLLGRDRWLTVSYLRDDDPYHDRAFRFLPYVKWNALRVLASCLRNGILCTIGNEVTWGEFNLVRQIIFDDQVSWVVKLRMPPVSGLAADKEAASVEQEVAIMKFLRYVSSSFMTDPELEES